MADWRGVRKKICLSRRVGALRADGACLLYTWLLLHGDINGNVMGDIEDIKHYVVPKRKRITEKVILDFLTDIEAVGLISCYSVEGKTYIHLTDYEKQTPGLREDKENPEYPLFTAESKIIFNDCPAKPGTARQSPLRIYKNRIDKSIKGIAPQSPAAADFFYKTYEAKQGKPYVRNFARDRSDFKTLLAVMDIDTIKACIARYFMSADAWYIKKGYDIPTFKHNINALRPKVTQAAVPPMREL